MPLAPWLRRVDLGRRAAGLPLMLAAYLAGIALSRAVLPLAAEVVGIAVATVFGCWLFVQIGKRAGPLAPLFGMARPA